MEIDGLNIKMLRSEVSEWCPLDTPFAASQVRRYGIPLVAASKRMSHYASCPAVLEKAGYSVEIIEEAPDVVEVVPGNIPEPSEPVEMPKPSGAGENPGV